MKRNGAAIIIAIGLVGMGLAIGLCALTGLSRIGNDAKKVEVRGLSEREVEANKVTWPVVYRVIGNELQDINHQIEQGNRAVVDFLTKNGLTKEDFTVTAPKVIDKQADRYSNEVISSRYMATSAIIVTTDKVELVRKLILRQGELIKQGVAVVIGDYEYSTIYEYTDLNAIKPEMIAEATKKAREAADKFAEDSGCEIGSLKSAYQGQFSIEDRDPYTPFIKKIRVVTTMTYCIDD